MIVAIDFDGTLHDAEYPNIGKPVPGAVEALQGIHEDGHYIILWTCRQGQLLVDAINWMLDNSIPFHRINDNAHFNTERYGDNSRKVYAHVYIDDKGISGIPDWTAVREIIHNKSFNFND